MGEIGKRKGITRVTESTTNPVTDGKRIVPATATSPEKKPALRSCPICCPISCPISCRIYGPGTGTRNEATLRSKPVRILGPTSDPTHDKTPTPNPRSTPARTSEPTSEPQPGTIRPSMEGQTDG